MMPKKNILFISLSNIGDAILTTPVLQALHKLYPEAKIDIVSDHRSNIIYNYCPYRGEIFLKNKQRLFRGGLSLVRELRQKHYDLIVDLRTDGLTLLLKGQTRLTKWQAAPYGPHVVEEHMGVIRKINTDGNIPRTKIWITEDHMEFAKECIQNINSNRSLVIAPGCHVPIKVWSPKNYASLCNKLASEIDAVVLLGSSSEKTYADEVIKELSVPFKDLMGRTDLLQAAAILNLAKMFIGNDSGLGHIASTANIPTLTLFGIGEPLRYRPWGDKATWLHGKNNEINNIEVEEVKDTLLI
jgi:ADP-heptose:LPS heptosyltransferase